MEKEIFVVTYADGMYPEDDDVIGVYETVEDAETAIKKEVANYKLPRNKAKEHNYKINGPFTMNFKEKENEKRT